MNQSILDAKKAMVIEVTEKLKASKSAIIVEYRGLTVKQVTDLRRELRKDGIEFTVYKNSFTQRAAADLGYDALSSSLTGPNAIAFGDDAVAPSRILAKFAKKHKKLVLKGGIVEGTVCNAEKIAEVSAFPGRDGMYSQILGMLQSPVRSFAYALQQIADQKSV